MCAEQYRKLSNPALGTFFTFLLLFVFRAFGEVAFPEVRSWKAAMSSWMQAGVRGSRAPLSTLDNGQRNSNSRHTSVACSWPTEREENFEVPLKHRPGNVETDSWNYQQPPTQNSPSLFFGTKPFSGFNLKHDTETLKRESRIPVGNRLKCAQLESA